MLFLYRFFSGVLKVEFYGIYPEKVLNLCAKNGIYLWSAKYKKGRISCKITIRSFLRLRYVLRNSGMRVHILEKHGFPFIIKKYKNRFGIFFGIVLFMTFLQVMSGYIWVIDVVGNKTVSDQQILSNCEEIGVKTGIRKTKISQKTQAQNLLLKNDRLAWGSFNIEGCLLTVNVTEITEKQGGESASNLVANSDGTVKRINVKSGDCVVKVGDVVKTGDVLVSGVIETPNGTSFVRSSGEIIALTETEIEIEEPLERIVKYNTGETKTKRVLEFFTLEIPLYLGREKGEYESYKTVKSLKLFGRNLPIKIHEKKFVFKTSQTVKITLDEAKERLNQRAFEEFETVKNISIMEGEEKIVLSGLALEEKNIAVSQNMIVDKEK